MHPHVKTPQDYVRIAQTLDKAAKTVGVNFIGGYSALVSKGMTKSDELLIQSIPEALATTDFVCSSPEFGASKNPINIMVAKNMGENILQTAEANQRERQHWLC